MEQRKDSATILVSKLGHTTHAVRIQVANSKGVYGKQWNEDEREWEPWECDFDAWLQQGYDYQPINKLEALILYGIT